MTVLVSAERGLCLSVQSLFQHELRELTAVAFGLDSQAEAVIGRQVVRPQRVDAHVRVPRALETKTRSWRGRLRDLQRGVVRGELRCVIVHVRNFYDDAMHFELVLEEDLKVQETHRDRAAYALPVNGLLDDQGAVVRVDLEELATGVRNNTRVSLNNPLKGEAQIICYIPYNGARLLLLFGGVLEVPEYHQGPLPIGRSEQQALHNSFLFPPIF
uniref:Uncharacterized protein n=1 Tax=Pygocentrus nattereri TaxID=42514 RepID=A0A3B4DAH2_PYGNA